MTNEKKCIPDNIKALELPPAVSVTCEGITANLLLCYITEHKNGISPLSFAPHDHSAYELFIIEDGSLTIDIENEELFLGVGDFIVVPPHTTHELRRTSPVLRRFCLRFDLSITGDEHIKSGAPYIRGKLRDKNKRFIFETIDELQNIADDMSAPLASFRQKSLLGMILSYILEQMINYDIQPDLDSSSHVQLHAKIESYLYLNYSHPITLESMASYLSYSRTQMHRILDDCFGVSFTDKLREIRLSAAKRYLTENKAYTIEEIASLCGYETRQGFESMFLKFVGVTPNQYRKNHSKIREQSSDKI